VSLAAFRVTDMLMRRCTGMRAATISVEKVFFQVPRALLRLKAATPSPADMGEGTAYLAAWVTGARMEGTIR